MENEIDNEINNEIKQEKNNFFNNIIGQTINNAIDVGLKTILPDLIEDQVIDIKNALLENGLKAGIDTAIDSVIDIGKSTVGIFTGNFENLSQVKTAVGEGGIIDTISGLLNKAIDAVAKKRYINNTTANLIKSGKNVILENIENNIKKQIDVQDNLLKKLDDNINEWKACYENKDFNGMEEKYAEIISEQDKIIPLENILKETKRVEILHNLIKNNGQNFDITEEEIKLVENLSN